PTSRVSPLFEVKSKLAVGSTVLSDLQSAVVKKFQRETLPLSSDVDIGRKDAVQKQVILCCDGLRVPRVLIVCQEECMDRANQHDPGQNRESPAHWRSFPSNGNRGRSVNEVGCVRFDGLELE